MEIAIPAKISTVIGVYIAPVLRTQAGFRLWSGLGLTLVLVVLACVTPNAVFAQAVTAPVDPHLEKLPYEVVLLKGNLARGRKQYDVAIYYFNEASKRTEVTSKLYLLWSRMLRERGDLNGAADVLAQGLKKFPKDTALKFEQGFLLAFAERWVELEALLAGLSKSDRTHPFAYYLQGQMALAKGEYGLAAASFAESATNPHAYQAEAYAGLAAAERARGENQQVIQALEKAIASSKSARQRTAYEQQLDAFLKSSSKKNIYSLRYLAGIHYDSNLNLAPLLFADSALWAMRTSHLLQQQLNFVRRERTRFGVQAIVNQSLHFGPKTSQLDDFNATLLSGELYLRQELSKRMTARVNVIYDSVFLLFKAAGSETHFSERWRGGPELYWSGEAWGLDASLTPEWSRYYDGNPIDTSNDRSTDLLDFRLQLTPSYRLKRHTIDCEVAASLFNARGQNFDNVGVASQPGYRYNFDPYLLLASLAFEWRDYPSNSDGRQDVIAGVNLGLKRLLAKKHLVGLAVSYEENLDSGLYGYRRGIVGVNYQGLLVDL